MLITGCLFIFALVACGVKSQTSQTNRPKNSKEEVNEKKEKTNIKIINETFTPWKNSSGSVWVNYSSEIKNSGNAPAKIDDISVDLLDSKEIVLQKVPMIPSIPNIIMPNQTAYITESITLDKVKDPDKIKATNINIESSKTTDEPMMLKTDNVKLVKGFADSNVPYSVTGTVTNPHSEKADDILISAALYDDKGELLGVLRKSLDSSINPNGSKEFELFYPELPGKINGKVTKVNVIAYNSTIK